MGTTTADDTTAATTAPEAEHDQQAPGTPRTAETTEPGPAAGTGGEKTGAAAGTEEAEAEEAEAEGAAGAAAVTSGEEAGQDRPNGPAQGAAAVVSAALGLVSLSGSWLGTVAGAREQLIGQLRTATSASVATQVKEIYGDAWHTTALWGGVFALVALIAGVAVLARPAFGVPGRVQAPWIKSVAWAGVALGVVGLLLAVLKYTDVLLGLPSA
ncbi:hypothetical protein ABZ858_27410 [Streptomyces sp. NPDC047017]|uniref:hypothetical protein n=1 Tax=Streptomyces sp. NPDC047017 TaxID=3155024 RepID=UPI0033FB6C19